MLLAGKVAAAVFAVAATIYVSPLRDTAFQVMTVPAYGRVCGWNVPYDVVIIGAGSAGSVAAYILSADPNICVLLISDGNDPSLLHGTDTIGLGAHFCSFDSFPPPWPVSADMMYSYETTDPYHPMQPLIWKNKVWGGASAWNTGVVDACDCSYYDKIVAQIPGAADAGWSCRGVQDTFKRITTFKAPANYPPDTKNVHGTSGPIVVQVWQEEPVVDYWMQALSAVAGIPIRQDMNTNTGAGVGVVQRSIDTVNGKFVRQNTFLKTLVDTGYWNSAGTGTRKNLVVQSLSTVKRLIFSQLPHQKPTVSGFEYVQPSSTPGSPPISATQYLSSGAEVILTAGQPSTISLLELSGIGNCSYLSSLPPNGINCVYNNEAVGNASQNTQQIALIFLIKTPAPPRDNCNSQNAYWTSQFAQSLGQTNPDIALGSVYFLPMPWPGSNDTTLYSSILVLPAIYRNVGNPPGVFGSTHIRDADFQTKPKVTFNTNPTTFVEAVQKARATCDYIKNVLHVDCIELSPGLAAVPNNPAAISAWSFSVDFNDFAHMYGGAGMGGTRADGTPLPGAVVDPHLRVYGVNGLRVADLAMLTSLEQVPTHSFFYNALISGANVGQIILKERNSPYA